MSSITSRELEQLYTLHVKKLYRFFYYKILSQEAAEDLASETFLAFADAIKKEVEVEKPENYLYGIAHNVFTKYLQRKYRDHTCSLDPDLLPYLENFTEEREKTPLEDIAQKYIQLLPEKQKIVLELRLLKKLSLGEIAQQLGKNMNYVKTTQKRGIKNLKRLVACTP